MRTTKFLCRAGFLNLLGITDIWGGVIVSSGTCNSISGLYYQMPMILPHPSQLGQPKMVSRHCQSPLRGQVTPWLRITALEKHHRPLVSVSFPLPVTLALSDKCLFLFALTQPTVGLKECRGVSEHFFFSLLGTTSVFSAHKNVVFSLEITLDPLPTL